VRTAPRRFTGRGSDVTAAVLPWTPDEEGTMRIATKIVLLLAFAVAFGGCQGPGIKKVWTSDFWHHRG